MSTISVTGNKLKRVTASKIIPGFYKIMKDGKQWFSGSSVLTPIVWNNIIGVNFPNEIQHLIYLEHMEAHGGKYALIGPDEVEIDIATIQVH